MDTHDRMKGIQEREYHQPRSESFRHPIIVAKMAEPATSESSPDTDRDFDPSAEMMVHDFDDEQTMEEEEAYSNAESGTNELDDLQKEGDMPIEDLLSMYYSHQQAAEGEGDSPNHPAMELHESRSSSEEEILSNQDLTLDKEEIARDLQLKNEDEHEGETSVTDLLDSVEMPSQTVRLLRSNSQDGSSDDDSEDLDYQPVAVDDWKKVGSDYQAVVPQGLCKYEDTPGGNESENRLLWDPAKCEDAEVEQYLCEVHRQNMQAAQGVSALPQGEHVRDDEQALYLLSQCRHNVDEALRRRKMQSVPPSDPMSLWSEEECRNFESGLRLYGKDFYLVQQNKVKTRSVGELVQFYYLWKKTERHDVFANKNRLEKKKYALHPGITDYMDRFLDEQENPPVTRDRSSSPNINSLLYGDPKRHHSEIRDPNQDLATALDMVQKVVDTHAGQGLSPLKYHLNELHSATLGGAGDCFNAELAGCASTGQPGPSAEGQNLGLPVSTASFPPICPAPTTEAAGGAAITTVQPTAVTPTPPMLAGALSPQAEPSFLLGCPTSENVEGGTDSQPAAKREIEQQSKDGVGSPPCKRLKTSPTGPIASATSSSASAAGHDCVAVNLLERLDNGEASESSPTKDSSSCSKTSPEASVRSTTQEVGSREVSKSSAVAEPPGNAALPTNISLGISSVSAAFKGVGGKDSLVLGSVRESGSAASVLSTPQVTEPLVQ